MNHWVRGAVFTVCALGLLACDDSTETGAPVGGVMGQGGMAASTGGMMPGGTDEGGTDGSGGSMPMGCTPDGETWDTVRPTVETYCGLCHGDSPAFGAPYGLLDFDALITGDEGSRPVDRLVARMRIGDMPPVGQPTVPAADAMALLDWATCGANTGTPPPGPNPGGFDVTRPIFAPADAPPADAAFVEFRADNGHIPADVADQYTCFSFRGPGDADRFIRRFEPIIDDARVLHHIVLYEVDEGVGDGTEVECGSNLSAAIYAWAPGQQPVQFVEGGVTTSSSRRYLMEIHYNNSAAYEDVADQSGVRIYHTAPEGPEIDMLTVGPDGFRLPPMTRTAVEGSCAVTDSLTVIATLPHMHELGVSLKSTIKRAGGAEEDLITLTGWDFDSQLFYDGEGLRLEPGDQVVTECVFENPTNRLRTFGPFTENEMCYNFLFVTPPPASRRCNENTADDSYEPGDCAPSEAVDVAGSTLASPSEGSPPMATGGAFPRGLWRLVDYTLVFESADIGLAILDLDATTIVAAGAMKITDDGQIEFDVSGEINAVFAGGGGAARPVGLSFAGTVVEDDPATGTLRIATDCPGEGEINPTYTYADGRLTVYLPFMEMTTGVALPVFERVE